MITMDDKLDAKKVEVGQRYLAVRGPLSNIRFNAEDVYQDGCLISASGRAYRVSRDFFVGSFSGGPDTTPRSLILIN